MNELFVLLLATISSGLAYSIAKIRWANVPGSFRAVAQTFIECIGAATLFFIANVTLGIFLILTIRSITPVFVPLYVLANVLVAVLSLIQGFVFHLWLKTG